MGRGRGAGGRKRRPLALSPGVYVLARARRVLSGPWVAEAPHLLRGATLGPGALASCRGSCRARQAWLAPVEEGHCARAPGGKGSSFCGVSFWDWGGPASPSFTETGPHWEPGRTAAPASVISWVLPPGVPHGPRHRSTAPRAFLTTSY